MLDDLLIFEHQLRKHVDDVRASLREFLAEQGVSEYSQNVSIRFDADDGGRWVISHYSNKISTDVKAAELETAAEAFAVSYRMQHGNKTLRGLIAGPTNV